MIDTYEKAIKLLHELGFEEFDNSKDMHFESNIEVQDDCKLFTDAAGRNAIFILLYSENLSCNDLEYDFLVYVLNDVGCGAVLLPFRWVYLDPFWIKSLQNSFGNHSNKI